MNKCPIRVKLLSRESISEGSIWKKQCPNNNLRWGKCIFITDPKNQNYDWYVTRNDIPYLSNHKEILSCNQNNSILFTTEPSSITRYGKAFANQFGYLLTSQDQFALPHKNALRSPTGNVWHYGKSYDQIISEAPSLKIKKISTVCSTKYMKHTDHNQRLIFTKKLKKDLVEMDLFGKGHNYIKNKYQAIDPYQFHLVIENHSSKYHFTEKITDAFLGYSIPIYYGCSNIFDYFPEKSLIQIDIYNYEESLKKINDIIHNKNEYLKRLDAIIEARESVLNKYNLPAMIAKIVESHKDVESKNQKNIIYSRRCMRIRYPVEFLRFSYWKIKNYLEN